MEDGRKKAVAVKLSIGKNKPKFIVSQKTVAKHRQRRHETVIKRKAHKGASQLQVYVANQAATDLK